MRRAAERMHLSHAALSQHVQHLEEAFGLRLLAQLARAAQFAPADQAFGIAHMRLEPAAVTDQGFEFFLRLGLLAQRRDRARIGQMAFGRTEIRAPGDQLIQGLPRLRRIAAFE
ncbi:LysR family transcriptional regulator [Lysobacter sp. 2RAB21]